MAARLYMSVEKAAMALLRKKYGYTNQAQIRNIIKEYNMSGYFDEAQKLFNKGLNEASRQAGANWHKPMFNKRATIQPRSLLQEAVKRLDAKKQEVRNAEWRKNHKRTRLTETIMSEAAEDFILGQGNH